MTRLIEVIAENETKLVKNIQSQRRTKLYTFYGHATKELEVWVEHKE